jgi:biopolymer transport protein ExbD
MSRLQLPRRPHNDDDRILPLINVVFLLMIFFMLAGRVAALDPFQVEPPRSASAGLLESRETIVLLGADGTLALDGQVMDAEQLADAVAARVDAEGADAFRFKADGRADATRVVEIMEILREAGVGKLRLLTLPEVR